MGKGGESSVLPGASSCHVLPPIPSNDDYNRDPAVYPRFFADIDSVFFCPPYVEC